MNSIKKQNMISLVFDRIMGFFFFVAAILLIFMLLAVLIEVVARYFFNKPQMWVIESSEYSLLYITFLGAAWLLRKAGHIKVDLLVNRLNQRTRTVVDTITSFIGILISAIITWYGLLVTIDVFQQGIRPVTALEPPLAILTAIVPLGGFLLLIQFIRATYSNLKALIVHRKMESQDISEITPY